MGAQETKAQGEQDFKSYMDKFVDKGKVNDKLYGEGKLVQSKATKVTMFVKEYTTNDESSFKQQLKKFDERCKVKHANLVDLQGYTYQSEPQFCSTIYKTYLMFEYCTKNLDADIGQRKLDNSKYYMVEEMWRMLQSYVSGFAFLQSRKLAHGDVKLANLFIAPNGEFKIAEQGMLNPNSSFAQIISGNSKEHKGIYLSPLLLKAVESMNLRPKHNIFKSDVFSLGLCIINAALLESCDEIYNFTKYTINSLALEEKIEKMKIQYPVEFVSLIQQMVVLEEKDRLDFIFLEKQVNEQKKLFFERFAPKPVPTEQSYQNNTQLAYSSNVPVYREEKVYKEPVIEKVITFKQESNHSSPQFESAQYRQIPEQSSTYNYNYNEPFDIHHQSPQKPQTYNVVVTQQPVTQQPREYHEEGVKRSFNATASYENRDNSVTKTTEVSVVSKPIIESSVQVQNQPQDNNYRSVADYPVNYDDINSLLKKYGIEPLQPLQSVQSPVKTFANEQKVVTTTTYTTNTSFKNEQPPLTYQPTNNTFGYSQPPKVESYFVEQKPAEGNKFQNYSEILRNYEDKKPIVVTNEAPKRYGFEQDGFQVRNEERPPAYFAENRCEPQNFQMDNRQAAFEVNRTEVLRSEQPKRHGFEKAEEQQVAQNPQNYETMQYKYEYRPINETAEFTNNSIDFYSNYNRPSDMNPQMNAQPQGQVFQARVEPNIPIYQQQQPQKPSLYDNVSFANEFFETKTQENKHEELKKKSSINEMKKSLNNSDTKEVVIENYQNGAKYEGEKIRGMRHGRGRFFYSDGGVYDGEWKENRMYGKGILYYGCGKIAYEGDWIDDKFEGQGILYNESPIALNEMFDFHDFDNIDEFWVKYEGGFHNDNKEGYGVLYLTNGEKFVGYFKEDNMEGRGMYYKANGELVSGMWRANKFTE